MKKGIPIILKNDKEGLFAYTLNIYVISKCGKLNEGWYIIKTKNETFPCYCHKHPREKELSPGDVNTAFKLLEKFGRIGIGVQTPDSNELLVYMFKIPFEGKDPNSGATLI